MLSGFQKCLFDIEMSVSIYYRSGLYILSSAQSRSFIKKKQLLFISLVDHRNTRTKFKPFYLFTFAVDDASFRAKQLQYNKHL